MPPQEENPSPELKLRKPRSLLNRAVTREFIFDAIKVSRPGLHGKIERISASAFERIEASLRRTIHCEVSQIPSVGKTMK
jgi:hypothetical protein